MEAQNKTYETMLSSGTKVRFEYEDKKYSLVGIYVNDEYSANDMY